MVYGRMKKWLFKLRNCGHRGKKDSELIIMGLITTADIHERFEGLRRLASFQKKGEQTAGIVASYKIAFLIDRRFS